ASVFSVLTRLSWGRPHAGTPCDRIAGLPTRAGRSTARLAARLPEPASETAWCRAAPLVASRAAAAPVEAVAVQVVVCLALRAISAAYSLACPEESKGRATPKAWEGTRREATESSAAECRLNVAQPRLHPLRVLGAHAQQLFLNGPQALEAFVGVHVVRALAEDDLDRFRRHGRVDEQLQTNAHGIVHAALCAAQRAIGLIEALLDGAVGLRDGVRIQRVDQGREAVVATVARRIDRQARAGAAHLEFTAGPEYREVARGGVASRHEIDPVRHLADKIVGGEPSRE